MRAGIVLAGLFGSAVIGVMFWLAIFGFVQLSRPGAVVSAPGVAVAPAPRPAGGSQAVKIVASDLKFDQKEIKVAAGQPVELTLENKGVLEHDVTIQDPAFKVTAQGGQTAKGSFTPAREGTYEFFC